jgi:rod shape-determining protein MreD
LYFSVLNEFDIDVSNLNLLSFNLPFIIIFYWSLKDPDHIGNGLIFISGILNDVTLGYPVGLSSFIYLIIIAFAAYLRNITLRPNIYKDSIVFLVAILFANSVNALILSFIFSIEIIFFDILTNTTFTFLLYFLFAKMFNYLKPVRV